MKAVTLAALLALASCTSSAPAYAGPATPPGKDSVDASGIDISFPMDLSSLTPAQKQAVIAEYCNQGCMVVPNEVIDQIEAQERAIGAAIQRQQQEILQYRADKAADERIIEGLKSQLKATT